MGNLHYLRTQASQYDKTLDIGSKTGEDMSSIRGETFSIDIQFQSTSSSNTEYVRADGTQLLFSDNTFDYVYCNHVLEHINDKYKLLSSIRRVLKPGGEALFAFPNRLSPHAPHSPPGWYSYLPESVGNYFANLLLDNQTAEYYCNKEFMFSLIYARILLQTYLTKLSIAHLKTKLSSAGVHKGRVLVDCYSSGLIKMLRS